MATLNPKWIALCVLLSGLGWLIFGGVGWNPTVGAVIGLCLSAFLGLVCE